jgi:tetratricopeptide (TPR) repeat protein
MQKVVLNRNIVASKLKFIMMISLLKGLHRDAIPSLQLSIQILSRFPDQEAVVKQIKKKIVAIYLEGFNWKEAQKILLKGAPIELHPSYKQYEALQKQLEVINNWSHERIMEEFGLDAPELSREDKKNPKANPYAYLREKQIEEWHDQREKAMDEYDEEQEMEFMLNPNKKLEEEQQEQYIQLDERPIEEIPEKDLMKYYKNLVMIYRKQEKWEDAIKSCQKLYELHKKYNGDDWYGQSVILSELGGKYLTYYTSYMFILFIYSTIPFVIILFLQIFRTLYEYATTGNIEQR